MAEAENGGIRFTIKEYLSRIEGKLDAVVSQLQQKADVAHVQSLAARVDTLERDMQEGKETVKSMLIPDFHEVKTRVADMEAGKGRLGQLENRLRKAELTVAKLVVVAVLSSGAGGIVGSLLGRGGV